MYIHDGARNNLLSILTAAFCGLILRVGGYSCVVVRSFKGWK